MDLKSNNDTLLKIGRIVADVVLGVECAFFLIFGIAACVNVSLFYLLMVFLGPAFSFASWIFERILIAIGHDVKMTRDRMMNTGTNANTESSAPAAPAQEQTAAHAPGSSTEATTVKKPTDTGDSIFCMNCGAKNNGTSEFCGKCGGKLSV